MTITDLAQDYVLFGALPEGQKARNPLILREQRSRVPGRIVTPPNNSV